jgi:REP element-mobilizing transposase RayT
VRRAFLCGEDRLTGRNFDHRKQWLVERLATLGELFAIDICAYAVMSNHYHLVVRLAPTQVESWDRDEVMARWSRLFSLPAIATKYRRGEALLEVELERLDQWVAQWKARLCDLSWFMRCLNEPVARQANAEDGCTGRFWEGRFKSQALLDEAALITAMAYVDLNPVRAGMAETPEESDFTSIQERIQRRDPRRRNLKKGNLGQTVHSLLSFADQGNNPDTALPFNFPDYLELVDWSGRAIVQGKRGAIPEQLTRTNLLYSPEHDNSGIGSRGSLALLTSLLL